MLEEDEKYKNIAKICQALANPTRLKILDILISKCTCNGSGCCVTDINNEIDLPQPYISKHLKVLKDCNILTYTRDANKIYYSFQKNDLFTKIIDYLGKCCSANAEIKL